SEKVESLEVVLVASFKAIEIMSNRRWEICKNRFFELVFALLLEVAKRSLVCVRTHPKKHFAGSRSKAKYFQFTALFGIGPVEPVVVRWASVESSSLKLHSHLSIASRAPPR